MTWCCYLIMNYSYTGQCEGLILGHLSPLINHLNLTNTHKGILIFHNFHKSTMDIIASSSSNQSYVRKPDSDERNSVYITSSFTLAVI